MKYFYNTILCGLILFCAGAYAQQTKVRNNYIDEKGLNKLKVERTMIYQPKDVCMYSHHQSITFFKKTFFAIWSNGMTDEDQPGQRVVYATSKDFIHWTAPKEL